MFVLIKLITVIWGRLLTINSRRTRWTRIYQGYINCGRVDHGSINCGLQVQEKLIAEEQWLQKKYQVPSWWEWQIWGHKCESIDNQQKKTRVIEDWSGVYQLGNVSESIFSKIIGIFDIIIPVIRAADKWMGRWEQAIDLGSDMQINLKPTS